MNRKDSEATTFSKADSSGLDNIGVFDRCAPLPTGGIIEQSDGTSLDGDVLPEHDEDRAGTGAARSIYEDVASKFFEHFLYIADAMNQMGDGGLWDENDGFFYDRLVLARRPRMPCASGPWSA